MAVEQALKTCRRCGYVKAVAELARTAIRLGRKDAEHAPGFSAGFVYTEIELNVSMLETSCRAECGDCS